MTQDLTPAQRREIVKQAAALLHAYTGSPRRAAARLGLEPDAPTEWVAGLAEPTDVAVERAFPRAQRVVDLVDAALVSLSA